MAGLPSGLAIRQSKTSGTAMFLIGLAFGVLLGVTVATSVFSLLLWALQEKEAQKRHL
jgi:hypothetical protein